MDLTVVEQLLNEAESTSLDFKRDQYRFSQASDEEKSELLKDILALANAWRRSDAFLLIGVVEVKGGRSTPVGVDVHLDDAQLQQFVNAKVQRPITFECRTVVLGECHIDIIRIPIQARPCFLTKDYGKLKKDTVYVRYGSATAIASLDEILKMQMASQATTAAALDVVVRPNDQYSLDFIIGIANAHDAASAVAPYLEFEVPETYTLAEYGLDGYGRHGLPLIPQSGSDAATPKFRADSNTLIPAGTTCDVARIKHKNHSALPESITIKYKVAAANGALKAGSVTIASRK
jgi:hypothetical protein